MVSLVITIIVLGVLLVVIITTLQAGGLKRSAVAAGGSLIVWLSTITGAHIVGLLRLLDRTHREPPTDDEVLQSIAMRGDGEFEDLLAGLGWTTRSAGLLASERDRLWTLERLEIAEVQGALSIYSLGFLRSRVAASRCIPELYQVMTEALRSPGVEEVDTVLEEVVRAVADGQVSEEEMHPLLERFAREGSHASLHALAAAHHGRPTNNDRAMAQRTLDDALVTGRLAGHSYAERSQRTLNASSKSELAEVLDGLAIPTPLT